MGQAEYILGVLPEININKSLSNEWKVNANVESRQAFREGLFEESPAYDYEYLLTDISAAVTKGMFFQNAWTLGYLLRLQKDAPAHRLFQQYTFNRRYVGFRIGYRLAADQTFERDVPTEFRFRFRASGELPLRGQAVDRGEYYLKASHEYLNKWAGETYDLETRFTAALGRQIRDFNKLEIGLDYRIDNFLNGAPASSFWMTAGWFFSF